MSDRACGECTLCCTVLRIVELNKPEGVSCDKLRPPGEPPGCSIFGSPERPPVCGAYLCWWMMEGSGEVRGSVVASMNRAARRRLARATASTQIRALLESERPDKLGIIFSPGGDPSVAERVGSYLVARECWPGAFNEKPVRETLDRLSSQTVVFLVHGKDADKNLTALGPVAVLKKLASGLE